MDENKPPKKTKPKKKQKSMTAQIRELKKRISDRDAYDHNCSLIQNLNTDFIKDMLETNWDKSYKITYEMCHFDNQRIIIINAPSYRMARIFLAYKLVMPFIVNIDGQPKNKAQLDVTDYAYNYLNVMNEFNYPKTDLEVMLNFVTFLDVVCID